MADKFHSDTQEKIESILYTPHIQNSGDLEAGTKTITATSEASGLGNADYNAALTLAKPSDARLIVKRIAARLSFTIDSFDTATILYCRVYVDAQDADHLLFDTSHNAASNKLAVQDTLVGTKEVIFNLLKDGAAHTFYFFFWVNQANNAVISVVQLWEGVGSCVTSGGLGLSLELDHKGFVGGLFRTIQQGTGTPYFRWCFANDYELHVKTGSGNIELPLELMPKSYFFIYGTVATDINCLYRCGFILRSEL